MDKNMIMRQYQQWIKKANWDQDVINELEEMQKNTDWIEDAFYKVLNFGTGGLRGVLGAGTNRMNVHVVAHASQGVAEFVKRKFPLSEKRIAVSYDSRIKSSLFAKVVSDVLAANGFEVFVYEEIMPTPCLSFAVRQLKCVAGIMITASHNPAKYNGYKVYGTDGCQITTKHAIEIQDELKKLDIFEGVKYIQHEVALQDGKIKPIPANVYDKFIEAVKRQSLIDQDTSVAKNLTIVYSPLNGTGLKPILRILNESGYSNISVVAEQEKPDGNFPTCPTPNPELEETMILGVEYAKRCNADIILATDPDCDRVSVGVRRSKGEYTLLSGNQTGLLLVDYICNRLIDLNIMPKNPVLIKTIVSSDMAEKIAQNYGVKCINVLTGFKYIGEQIGRLKRRGEESFLFAFEESCGYLRGTYVRDKDAVGGCFLICEMTAYYKARGTNLLDRLEELYSKYGYSLNTLHSYEFEGVVGISTMKLVMNKFRKDYWGSSTIKVRACLDYEKGLDDLPKSDVLKFQLDNDCSVVIRPSGTEPKIKAYICVNAKTREKAITVEKEITRNLAKYIEEIKH